MAGPRGRILNSLRFLSSSSSSTSTTTSNSSSSSAGKSSWNPRLKLPSYSAGTPNLEVVKFGLYIMVPIGWMYYFGTNLENRFSVPDFWPQPGTTNRIPLERDEQRELEKHLRAARLERRERRLRREREGVSAETEADAEAQVEMDAELQARQGTHGLERAMQFGLGGQQRQQSQDSEDEIGNGKENRHFGRGAIERWARGEA